MFISELVAARRLFMLVNVLRFCLAGLSVLVGHLLADSVSLQSGGSELSLVDSGMDAWQNAVQPPYPGYHSTAAQRTCDRGLRSLAP
jgi:hypothetical protein